jgi:NADPH-dependent curcumin reductase CurA
VGGEHLEAAIGAFNEFGRAALCGAISSYNATEPQAGPRNMFMMVSKKLSLRGFIVSDHSDMHAEFISKVTELLTSGRLVVRETVREGLEDAVPAFLDLLRGGNTGKMVVRLATEN